MKFALIALLLMASSFLGIWSFNLSYFAHLLTEDKKRLWTYHALSYIAFLGAVYFIWQASAIY